jgi:hypothetical protein
MSLGTRRLATAVIARGTRRLGAAAGGEVGR